MLLPVSGYNFHMPYQIPDTFGRMYANMFGEAGEQWTAALPGLLSSLEARWSIRLLAPYPLSYNYVAPAVRADGQPVVLKVGYPHNELISEMHALRHYAGRGIVQLHEADEALGAMLLERVEPGRPLVELVDQGQDDAATRAAAQVMQALWIPAPPDPEGKLLTAVRWGKGFQRLRAAFNGGTGPFPAPLVDRAERIFRELLDSSAAPALLHGDLHHWNIISAARAPWLALDPKGLVAEPAYEAGALLRNPWPKREQVDLLLRCLPRRLDILHEMLGLDRQRMLLWTFAQAVLSAWWTYEDHHEVSDTMLMFAQGHGLKAL